MIARTGPVATLSTLIVVGAAGVVALRGRRSEGAKARNRVRQRATGSRVRLIGPAPSGSLPLPLWRWRPYRVAAANAPRRLPRICLP